MPAQKLCRCGPGDIRPKRGTRCGACNLYVLGPARASDTAFELPQTRHPADRPERVAGIVGATLSEDERLERDAGRAMRRRTRLLEVDVRRHSRRRQSGRAIARRVSTRLPAARASKSRRDARRRAKAAR